MQSIPAQGGGSNSVLIIILICGPSLLVANRWPIWREIGNA
jgi:hypothetical protein